MSEALFDLSAEYDEMLNRGIRLSGESREFFIQARLQSLKRNLPPDAHPKRILDFGCGTGTASQYLAEYFPDAEVLGIDTSKDALAFAAEHYGSPRIRFQTVEAFQLKNTFDLCYVNGVFHHIELTDRLPAVRTIYDALRLGGYLALFENNPWNPGARMVMKRIPFDRDAKMLTPIETKALTAKAGFGCYRLRSLCYFPRALSGLRFLEPMLGLMPLGAQYYVLAEKRVPNGAGKAG